MTERQPSSDRTLDPAPEPGREARLEVALESVSDAFYALDPDWRYVMFNRAAEALIGLSREQLIGRTIWDAFPQSRGGDFERYCRAAMDKGETTTFEALSWSRPGRVLDARVAPMRGGGITISLTDVTDRRRAENALLAALARSGEILESISDAFYAVDSEWRFTYVNKVAEAWWKRPREGLLGKVIWDEFPWAVGRPSYEAHLTAAREQRVVRVEAFLKDRGRWVDGSIFPSENGLSVYFRDITERKEAEERQRLLVNELNHRVKNSLATVQAIAAQSLRGPDVPEEARERFLARLIALARANDLLVAERWHGASLGAIAAQVASPYAGTADAERFRIEGPPVELSPKAAIALALALHELATNAAKYGALSAPGGRVELSWSLEGEGAAARLRLTWREVGGPPASQPTKTGFGSRLLERGLSTELRAKVNLDYRPSGLVFTLTAPMNEGLGPKVE